MEARGLCKRWPHQQRAVLERVGLVLRPGTGVWIGGANGAGKTTLLRLLAGLLEPDAGEVLVDGLRHRGRERSEYQRRISLLSAGAGGVYGRLTTRHHLELQSRLHFVAAAERPAREHATLLRFGLQELEHRRADRMSMGQRQRLRLAMAFLPPARLLLLDEPVTSLDEPGIAALHAALDAHLRGGGAAVWCSPSLEQLPAALTVRFAIVDGRLVPA